MKHICECGNEHDLDDDDSDPDMLCLCAHTRNTHGDNAARGCIECSCRMFLEA